MALAAICRRLIAVEALAFPMIDLKAAMPIAIRIATMTMTTRSSTRVKPRHRGVVIAWLRREGFIMRAFTRAPSRTWISSVLNQAGRFTGDRGHTDFGPSLDSLARELGL